MQVLLETTVVVLILHQQLITIDFLCCFTLFTNFFSWNKIRLRIGWICCIKGSSVNEKWSIYVFTRS